MSKRIYLVRHGEIDYGIERRYIGITDYPLSNKGIEQIQRMKSDFEKIKAEKIYCSPLLRCRQTAEILRDSNSVELEIVKELEEIHMGDWENKTMAAIKRNFPDLYKARGEQMGTFIPPEGESFEQLQRRVFPAFQRIVEETTECGIIIAHAGVNRVILSKLRNLPLEGVLNIEQAYGCVTELEFNEGRFVT